MTELPSLTVIIPTYNSAPLITDTLDSLLEQNYPSLEIIIVDGGSRDRTLEILGDKFKIEVTAEFNLYEMLNKGIAKATTQYVAMLYPGDSYLSKDVLIHLGELAHLHMHPDLIFGGCLRRDRGKEPVGILCPLNTAQLKKGRHPPSIQACLFLRDALLKIGRFDDSLICKGNFDLFCRYNEERFKFIETHQILVDYDKRRWPIKWIIREAIENLIIIKRYFGLMTALRWAGSQKLSVFLSYLAFSFKESFQKR